MNKVRYNLHKILIRLRKSISTSENYYLNLLKSQQEKKIYPEVLNIQNSIDKLVSSNKSLARFGDGEFLLCFGKDIGFQKSNKKLKFRLRKILDSQNSNCLIALTAANEITSSPYSIEFFAKHIYPISTLINKNNTYLNPDLSRSYSLNQLETLSEIWENKKVIFVVGKNSRFEFIEENSQI